METEMRECPPTVSPTSAIRSGNFSMSFLFYARLINLSAQRIQQWMGVSFLSRAQAMSFQITSTALAWEDNSSRSFQICFSLWMFWFLDKEGYPVLGRDGAHYAFSLSRNLCAHIAAQTHRICSIIVHQTRVVYLIRIVRSWYLTITSWPSKKRSSWEIRSWPPVGFCRI